ncbi:unnamed protein product [Amoebophrya sp. A120]|nr:unnamed protein product [Amoebophrya sp. A120]|eukprot:GSA120T00018223001.1
MRFNIQHPARALLQPAMLGPRPFACGQRSLSGLAARCSNEKQYCSGSTGTVRQLSRIPRRGHAKSTSGLSVGLRWQHSSALSAEGGAAVVDHTTESNSLVIQLGRPTEGDADEKITEILLVVPRFKDEEPTKLLPEPVVNFLTENGVRFEAKTVGATTWVYNPSNPSSSGEAPASESERTGSRIKRTLLVGLGESSKLTCHRLLTAVNAARAALDAQKVSEATLTVLSPARGAADGLEQQKDHTTWSTSSSVFPVESTPNIVVADQEEIVEAGADCSFHITPRTLTEAFFDASYKFDQLRKKKSAHENEKPSKNSRPPTRHIWLAAPSPSSSTSESSAELHEDQPSFYSSCEFGSAVAAGSAYARTLKNLPANICNTDYMVSELEKLARQDRENDQGGNKIMMNNFSNLTVFATKELEAMGFGCLTAVGRGSATESYLTRLEWRHAGGGPSGGQHGRINREKTIVLVGKGVVHDSGGLNLKLGSGMSAMKMDMGGAACVLGVLKALSQLFPPDGEGRGSTAGLQTLNTENKSTGETINHGTQPVRVVGILPLVENSISGSAYRPGDVLTSLDGLTVEVNNTDAEGRLILCDALTWAQQQYPDADCFIDIATLTGAMVTAVGPDFSGLFTNCSQLKNELLRAGLSSGDRAWPFPLVEAGERYEDMLKSKYADLSNIGSSGAAGSITAALFLKQFITGKNRWAHLDIAGSAMGGSFDKASATGRPVPLLVEFIAKKILGMG